MVSLKKVRFFFGIVNFFEVLLAYSVIFCQTESYNAHSKQTVTELIERIERMSKLIDFILNLGTASAVITPLLTAFTNYFIYGMGNESFVMDGTMWLPFDPNKPVGFFVILIFTTVSIYATACFFKPIICIFIGSCWSIVTFLNVIANDVSHLEKKKILKLNNQELIKRFSNFVQFHAEVEELSGHFICAFATPQNGTVIKISNHF